MTSPLFTTLFPGMTLRDVQTEPEHITITMQPQSNSASCPRCGEISTRIHSSYTRSPHDVPLAERLVRIIIQVRRFRCPNPLCGTSTFAERLPQLLAPYAQRTLRLQRALVQLGLALGGAAGARTANHLYLPTSRNTVLRLVQRLPPPTVTTPRVLGVDDFAFRKGKRYGTILLDLERRCPIDLLPERSASSLETWLKAHPGVQVIARDRGPEYIRGTTAGAPQAIQVADRFHLLVNLREALERVIDRERTHLRVHLSMSPRVPEDDAPHDAVPVRSRRRTGLEAGMRGERREHRMTRYETVQQLHQQGKTKSQIARELGLSRWLVRRFVEAEQFPERAPKRPQRSILTPFESILRKHWQQGEQTIPVLFGLLQSAGYTGSIHTVRRWVQQRRHEPAAHTKPAHRATYTVAPQERAARGAAQQLVPATRQLVWLLLNPAEDLSHEDNHLLGVLLQEPSIAAAYALAQRFLGIVRHHKLADFDRWRKDCANSGVADMATFAQGLQQDGAAVRAALTLPWSTGQVEGHITRLKLVKRQMYGRAGFPLLRQRILHAA